MAALIKKKGSMKPKNRKTKFYLEFDEKARQEYLRGFQKRKNERRKLAREEHDKKIMQERKELLKQHRATKHSQLRQAVIVPEIEHLVDPEVFDLPDHTVTIANIGEVDFVGNSGLRLGQNTGVIKGKENGPDNEKGNVKNLSLRQKLAACSNQLSTQKCKAKKTKKKNMLRQKFHAKKKGTKKGKKK